MANVCALFQQACDINELMLIPLAKAAEVEAALVEWAPNLEVSIPAARNTFLIQGDTVLLVIEVLLMSVTTGLLLYELMQFVECILLGIV